MKIFILLSLVSFNVFAECSVAVLAKKPESKSFYLTTGETISMSQVKKLSDAGCTVKARLMSADEIHAVDLAKTRKRLEKLEKGPQQAGQWFTVK